MNLSEANKKFDGLNHQYLLKLNEMNSLEERHKY